MALLTHAAGCGRPLASVEGTVTLDGRPLPDAEVQFLPDPTQGTTGPPSSAYTDPDGRYATTTVVGTHRV
ncbi:MAG: hypothetical protein ACRC33_11235, partial [Gemmataceae bacterium]